MDLYSDEIAYLAHYTKHIFLVALAWLQIRNFLQEKNLITEEEKNQIDTLIINHDQSKKTPEEWIAYARYFHPKGNMSKQERKKSFQKAVAIHKQRNLHHYESLREYKGPDYKCYLIEMVCDYIAMGWEFGNDLFSYYDKKNETIDLPFLYKEYLNEVIETLKHPSIKGIKEPFSFKRVLSQEKNMP